MLSLTQNYSRGRKRMIIQKKVMTESTNYLDMNKKRCHPSETKEPIFVLFWRKFFKPTSIDRSLLRKPLNLPKNPHQRITFHCLLLASTHKKILSPPKPKKKTKKNFFPPRPGFELTPNSARHPPRARLPAAALPLGPVSRNSR